jgi:glutamyl-tRNA synthetase
VPLVLGPDGARLAKRHGAVTLAEHDPRDVLAWCARTLALEGETAAEMAASFDRERLPREPTVLRDGELRLADLA